jgi:type IV secretory pathway VirB9-like protein
VVGRALYQVYAAPGQITNIALEPGESLTGAGPIAAGDTARWIIGDTESGSGVSRRVDVEFPRGIVQGEMPSIFVISSEGEAQIVNSRIY